MSFPFFPKPFACLLAATLTLLCASAEAIAAPTTAQAFGPRSWGALQQAGQPQIVVFSTSDCSHCPAAIDTLAEYQAKSPGKASLVVVVMDGRGQESSLLGDTHYRKANALYYFDGDAARLRYTVNPDWRGLTPYVVLLPKQGAARFFNGVPPAVAVRDFLEP